MTQIRSPFYGQADLGDTCEVGTGATKKNFVCVRGYNATTGARAVWDTTGGLNLPSLQQTRWQESSNNLVLTEGGKYLLNPAHTVQLLAMAQGAEILIAPTPGNQLLTLPTQISYPIGWTMVLIGDLQASAQAKIVCDLQNLKFYLLV